MENKIPYKVSATNDRLPPQWEAGEWAGRGREEESRDLLCGEQNAIKLR